MITQIKGIDNLIYPAIAVTAAIAIWYASGSPDPHLVAGAIPGLSSRPDVFMGPSLDEVVEATGGRPEDLE